MGLIFRSQKRLRSIALNDKRNWKARIEAVKLITDQTILAELACLHTDSKVRFTALEQLQQRDQIIHVAALATWMQSNNGSFPVNMAALDKLSKDDPEAFVAVMEMTEIDEVRYEAARRAGNSSVAREFWKKTFEQSSDLALRLEAADRMGKQLRSDARVQKSLLMIVRTVHDWKSRVKAATLLSDPEKARQYAIASQLVLIQGYGGSGNMQAAMGFKNITDPEIIDFILENKVSTRDEIGNTALRNLYTNIDPNSERAYRVIERAYKRRYLVKDTDELAKVKASPEWDLLERVTDQNMLRKLAASGEGLSYIRWRACEKSGGHVFGDNNCACRICGFENHSFRDNKTGSVCRKCGAKFVHVVSGAGDLWTSSEYIEHKDGTRVSLACTKWQTEGRM
ncbi:MAG: hypothetical protein J5589_02040 [Firmicutes bacterium]|nr:hypothetical protein [Bacillota bacterium]